MSWSRSQFRSNLHKLFSEGLGDWDASIGDDQIHVDIGKVYARSVEQVRSFSVEVYTLLCDLVINDTANKVRYSELLINDRVRGISLTAADADFAQLVKSRLDNADLDISDIQYQMDRVCRKRDYELGKVIPEFLHEIYMETF